MIYNFFELHPIITSNGFIFKNSDAEPRIVYALQIPDNINFFNYMQNHLYNDLVYNEDFYKSFELNKKYYVVPDKGYDFYVFEMNKGYCFYDSAEHDERVVIATELELDSNKMYI